MDEDQKETTGGPSSLDQTPQSKGGYARAKKLGAVKRREIARRAASGRWHADLPQATHEGEVPIGDATLRAAVLPNGKRILNQGTFLLAIGRSRTPKAGTGALSAVVDGLPFFLQAEQLKPFISDELRLSTTPLFFRTADGRRAVGYDAELLPMVCEVYLKLRDHTVEKTGKVPAQYEHIVRQCDTLMRGLAHVGIIALIDEATGYQLDRAKDALVKILEAFIAKELQPYIPTFPTDYYRELFRLRGLAYPDGSVKRPQYFGTLTNDLVYKRLAPGVLEELKRVTPRTESGRHKDKFFRRLTQNKGYPKLMEHLGSIVTMMKLSETWHQFMEKLDRLHPRCNETLSLPLDYRKNDDDGKGL